MVCVLSLQLDFHASCLYLSKIFLQSCCQHSAVLLKASQYLLPSIPSLGAHSCPFTALLSLSFPIFVSYLPVWIVCSSVYMYMWKPCLKINIRFFIYYYLKVPVNKIDSDEILPSTRNLIKKGFVLIQGRKSVLQCD